MAEGGSKLTIEELQVLIIAKTSELESKLKSVTSSLDKTAKEAKAKTSAISGVFKKLALGIAALGIGKIIKESISVGMDMVESESLFETSMKNMTDAARKWSEELQSTLGLNAVEVRKNVGVLYNMTTSMGLTSEKAYDLSTGLTELAYDMASFYNISAEEAFQKLQAGITGETEPLKRLGILIDEETVKRYAYAEGIAAEGAELTNEQKVLARYKAILAQTSNAQGDLTRTLNSPANQLRMLSTQLTIFKQNLGTALMPIVQTLLPVLNKVVVKLGEWAKSLNETLAGPIELIKSIFTEKVEPAVEESKNDAEDLASNADDAADSAKNLANETAKTAKAAKGALASFDEINVLSKDTSKAEEDVAITTPSGDYTPSEETKEEEVKVDLSGFTETGERIRELFQEIAKILSSVSENVKPLIDSFKELGVQFGGIFLDVASGPFKDLIDGIGKIVSMVSKNLAPVVKAIGGNIDKIAPGIIQNVSKVLKQISSVFDETSTMGKSIRTLFSAIVPVVNQVFSIVSNLGDLLFSLVDLLMPVIELILPVVTDIATVVFQIVGEATGFINEVLSFGVGLVEKIIVVIKPILGVIQEIYEKVRTLFEYIQPAIQAVFGIIKTVFALITGNFNDLKDIFGDFDSLFKTLLKSIANIFVGLLNLIVDGINKVFNFILIPVNAIIDGLNSAFGWAGCNIPNLRIEIPHIPKLAEGGLAYGPTLAMIGDNPGAAGDPEIVSPLSKLRSYFGEQNRQEVIDGMSRVIQLLTQINEKNSDVYLDGEKISENVEDHLERKADASSTRAFF